MRKPSEEERHLLDNIEYPPKWFWFKLAMWDIFNPKKRDRFLMNLKIGMNLHSALKELNIQYGHYDGKRYPVGTRLTSKENGEIIEASPDTPENEIVCIVEPDKK